MVDAGGGGERRGHVRLQAAPAGAGPRGGGGGPGRRSGWAPTGGRGTAGPAGSTPAGGSPRRRRWAGPACGSARRTRSAGRTRRSGRRRWTRMTGLSTYRVLRDRLAFEVERGKRSAEGFAVLFLDLDRFKEVNDQYGHEAGNEILRAVAGEIRNAVRASDVAARYGGDEFVVILTRTDLQGGARVAEALRAGIEGVGRRLGYPAGLVTVSIGLAEFDPREPLGGRPAGERRPGALSGQGRGPERRGVAGEPMAGPGGGPAVARRTVLRPVPPVRHPDGSNRHLTRDAKDIHRDRIQSATADLARRRPLPPRSARSDGAPDPWGVRRAENLLTSLEGILCGAGGDHAAGRGERGPHPGAGGAPAQAAGAEHRERAAGAARPQGRPPEDQHRPDGRGQADRGAGARRGAGPGAAAGAPVREPVGGAGQAAAPDPDLGDAVATGGRPRRRRRRRATRRGAGWRRRPRRRCRCWTGC